MKTTIIITLFFSLFISTVTLAQPLHFEEPDSTFITRVKTSIVYSKEKGVYLVDTIKLTEKVIRTVDTLVSGILEPVFLNTKKFDISEITYWLSGNLEEGVKVEINPLRSTSDRTKDIRTFQITRHVYATKTGNKILFETETKPETYYFSGARMVALVSLLVIVILGIFSFKKGYRLIKENVNVKYWWDVKYWRDNVSNEVDLMVFFILLAGIILSIHERNTFFGIITITIVVVGCPFRILLMFPNTVRKLLKWKNETIVNKPKEQ